MIDKTAIIAEVLEMDKDVAQVFFANGLFCVGCPSARMESIEDACIGHGLDADKLLKDINDYFAAKA